MAIIGKEQVVHEVEITEAFKKVELSIVDATTKLDLMCKKAVELTTALGGADTFTKLINAQQKGKKAAEEMSAADKEMARIKKELITVTEKLAALHTDEANKLTALKTAYTQEIAAINESITGKKRLAQAIKENSAIEAKSAQESKSFAVQQYEIEQKILALRKQLAIEARKTKTKEFQLLPTGDLTQMAALAREIKVETGKLNVIKSQIIAESLPNKLKNGTVDFGGYINQLTQVPLKLQQINNEYRELEKESERQLAIEKRKTIELEKQNNLTKKQKLERFKLTENIVAATPGSVGMLNAQLGVLKFDKKNSDSPAEIQRLTQAIEANKIATKELTVSTQKQKIADEQAIQAKRLVATALNAEKGSKEQLMAVNNLLALKQKQVNMATTDGVSKFNQLGNTINANKAKISSLNPVIENHSTAWGRLGRSIMTYASAYLGVQAVIQGAQAIYKQTKELDALNFSMRIIIKSSNEFAQTQKYLSDLAVNFGGNLITVTEGYVRFRAATVQSNMSALETQKIFTAVSKVSATLGLGEDKVRNIYLAMEQMISKGTVMTEELRRQLGNELPGAFGIMANALGVTSNELNKMLKAQQVISKDALPKFAVALEKAFGVENVKKVDTLAAAQGRLGTQVTGLIKGMSLSEGFKSFLNGMASVLGFIKDHIVGFSRLVKTVLYLSEVYLAHKVIVLGLANVYKIGVALKTAYVFITGKEIAATERYTAVQIASTIATREAAIATLTFSNIVKAFGGWWSIGLNAIVLIGAAMFTFKGHTEKTTDAMSELNKQLNNQETIIVNALDVLNKAKSGTEQYKEALSQLNTIALKYNQTLLTEKNTRDEVNESALKTLEYLDEEYLRKRKIVDLDTANANVSKATDPLQLKLQEFYKDKTGGPDEALLKYKTFVQAVKEGKDGLTVLSRQIREEFGTSADIVIRPLIFDAENGLKNFEKEVARIKRVYPKDIVEPPPFDMGDIEKAKKEYEQYDLFVKNGAKGFLPKADYRSKEDPTFVAWVNNRIDDMELARTKFDETSYAKLRESIFPEDRKKGGGGKGMMMVNKFTPYEEIKKANDKEIAEFKRKQQMELAIEAETQDKIYAGREKNAVDQVLFDGVIAQKEEDQKIEFINRQIELNKKFQEQNIISPMESAMGAQGITEEQKAQLLTDLAKFEEEKQQAITDAKIAGMKRSNALEKAMNRQWNQDDKDTSDANIAKAEELIHGDNMLSIQKANADIEIAIKEKKFDRIKTIKERLTQSMIENEAKRLQALIDAGGLTIEAERNIQERLNNLTEQFTKKRQMTDAEVLKVNDDARKELFQKEIELINEGFNFSKQINASQLASLEKKHNYELQLAGDSAEGKVIADRKYDAERIKLQRKQAIADKAQAAFNIVMNTIQGISNVWKISGILPPVAAALSAIIGGIGAVQLATVLATPIPSFFKGTGNAPATFIAGDDPRSKGSSELIELPSGESFLTPDRPTLFSDPKFKGSKIFPSFHDKTAQMLNSYAKNGGSQVFVDMSTSNRHLASMDEQMKKSKEERGFDANGKMWIRKGSVMTHYN